MLKNILKNTIIFLALMLLNCSSKQDCPEGINLLPMYGEVKKCKEQIESDNQFLSDCDKLFKTRKEAAEKYVKKAWGYFYNKDPETSMKRFNQAWLLDKNNAQVYWGFGNLTGMKGKPKESIPLFEKSIKLNPNNPKVYESLATSYGQLFYETKNVNHLNSTIDNLKKAIKLDKNNGDLYGKLSNAYAYFMQKDSLRKYIKIAEGLNSKTINPEVKRIAN